MEKIINKKFLSITSIVSGIIFIFILIGVKTIDVAQIGPNGTSIGFSIINKDFFEAFGYNDAFEFIADFLGIISFGVVCAFGLIGAIQLFFTRKRLFKVDANILILGLTYILVLLIYILFRFLVINYRPILVECELEPSFPSSHTILSIVVYGCAIIDIGKYVKNKKLALSLKIVSAVFLVTLVLCRLFSGVHWLTDILASIVLGICIVSTYRYILLCIKK